MKPTLFAAEAQVARAVKHLGSPQGDKRCTPDEVNRLLERDEHEESSDYVERGYNFGQRTRDTFQLADVFLRHDDEKAIERFLDLVFGCPFFTPTQDEHAMFLAYAASLRSSDLSRQVGAVIASAAGDIISVGTNDAPRAGVACTGRTRERTAATSSLDTIRMSASDASGPDRIVKFEAFVGVGPRRFFDLFSLSLASGISTKKRKKSGGEKASWEPETAIVCAPILPNSYLDREEVALTELNEDSEKSEGTP